MTDSGNDPTIEPATRVELGHTLAAARHAKGQSVADLAAAMNVRQTIVRSLESGDFTACGGDVYARGHIRAYARAVGIAADPLIVTFRQSASPAAVDAEPVAARPLPTRAARPLANLPSPLERTEQRWVPIAAAAAGLLVLAVIAQAVSSSRSAKPEAQAVPTIQASKTAGGSGTAARPTTSATKAAPSPADPSSAPTKPQPSASTKGVELSLRATKSSWVSVRTAAGKTLFSGMLAQGQAREFKDPGALSLTLGNAGGVELTVNGSKLGAAGASGQVRRLQLRPGEPLRL